MEVIAATEKQSAPSPLRGCLDAMRRVLGLATATTAAVATESPLK